jgi:hypothetical protein
MSVANIQNQKSVLAKLLAQENISVEHKKVSTAYFDPKNRILVLPIWKDMSADLYDLLVGHEVGHAWETPAEGWHSAIEEKGKGFKSFLNIVEDARIEKCIKNRYPGIRAPMYRGYKELFDKNFFGVVDLDLNTLSLIDKLNLHFKIGNFLNIHFSEEEKPYVNRMSNLQTWEDVYKLASDLYDYQKEINQKEYDDIRINEDDECSDDNFDINDYDGEEIESNSKTNVKVGKGSYYSGEEPYSFTDEIFREKEKSLLSPDVMPYVYANLPKLNFKDFIISYKDIYYGMDFSKMDSYSNDLYNMIFHPNIKKEQMEEESNVLNKGVLYNEYRNKNLKFINYLVKEFELKKNAEQLARASVSKTGELCMEKIWSYKLREDLFKRVTKIPNGKNHGMVMFLDWSGSMTSNITYTIEQILVLGDFCKKVNIPFEVFAFSDNPRLLDFKKISKEEMSNRFSKNTKDIGLNPQVHLLNFLSSQMSKNSYREAQFRLLQIAKIYEKENNNLNFLSSFLYKARLTTVPYYLTLSGTPLNEAIAIANYFVSWYKEQNKIDVLSTIFLTDGDGAATDTIFDENQNLKKFQSSSNNVNLVIKDTETNKSAISLSGEPVTSGLLRLLQMRSNTKLIGYFITERNVKYTAQYVVHNYGKNVEQSKIQEYLRKNKFYSVKDIGYDEYFIVQSKDLAITEDELQVNDVSAKREMLKAFIRKQKNKILNRVLLNKFIEQIA